MILMVFFHSENDNKIRRTCYLGFFKAQKQAAGKIDSLIKLNPRSQSLRLRQRLAEAKLALAIATENPAMAAAAEIEIQKILRLRHLLSLQQRRLIVEGQLALDFSQQTVLQELNGSFTSSLSKMNAWTPTSIYFKTSHFAQLGVLADDTDLAPIYSVDPKLESRQELGISWRKSHLAEGPLQNWFRGRYEENKVCSVIPKFQNQEWGFQVGQDKFW